ncbi:hypothetical protein Tco_1113592 [Tanacetum coccineum]|uniref:Uncharacterized protein n=1 Tax=Tanacetum coccineum TaxID=301880 RepID=A0ABQ5IWC7_9ASTR
MLQMQWKRTYHARNCPKPRVRDLKYFMEQMLLAKQDEAVVILTDEQNDFLYADASRMEEIEELSANICLMARIQPTNCWTINYAQINALYKDFVPQKELSAEQKYFPSSFIPSDKNSNATPSIPASMPNLPEKGERANGIGFSDLAHEDRNTRTRRMLQDDVSCGSYFLTRGGGCPMTACHVAALTANYMQVAANDWYEVAEVAGWLANKGVTRVHGDKKLQSWQTRDPRILEALIANH